MKTKYSVITKYPCSEQLANSLIDSWREYITANNPLVCAEEIYVRSNLNDCEFIGHENKYDSAWVLQCLQSQQFHWHSSHKSDIYYSLRRILFVANNGMRLSFFGLDDNQNFHEELIFEGPTFVELKFDGRTVHRFRPDKGKLYAYSFHYKDYSNSETTLASQSFLYEKEIPPVTNQIIL